MLSEVKHSENMFEGVSDIDQKTYSKVSGWGRGKKSCIPIQRRLIKAQYPCVVGSLVDTAAVCIDKISWGETIVWNAGSH